MSRKTVLVAIGLVACMFTMQASAATTFYVATNGNDAWSGHSATPRNNDGPLATLPEAIRRARSERRILAEIFLRGGVHVLAEPLVLTAQDSGLSISAYKKEIPVVSGQTLIARLGASRGEHESCGTRTLRTRN